MGENNNVGSIISVANLKGGVGKTTLATNLAVEAALKGFKTCLIDVDPNPDNGSKKWYDKRSNGPFVLVDIEFKQVTGDVFDTIQAAAIRNDIVIVDCGGVDSREYLDAIATSHLLLVPIECDVFQDKDGNTYTGLSADSIKPMDNRISRAKAGNRELLSRSVLTMYPTQNLAKGGVLTRKHLNDESKHLIPMDAKFDFRQEFRHSASCGAGVSEVYKGKAAGQCQLLFNEMIKILGE